MKQKEFYAKNIFLWNQNSREFVRNAYLDLLLEGCEDQRLLRILDVGCGCGQDEVLLSGKLQNRGITRWSGVAIDQNDEAIELAQKHIEASESARGRWELIKCDFFDSTAIVGKFSFIICSMIVMHYEDLCLCIDRLRQLLDKDGRLLLVTNNPELILKEYVIASHDKKYLHKFRLKSGDEIVVEKFFHTLSEYYSSFKQCGLEVLTMREIADYSLDMFFFNKIIDENIPNFLAFVLKRR